MTTSQQLTPDREQEIRSVRLALSQSTKLIAGPAGAAIDELLAEVHRLRAELAGPHAETLRAAGWTECSPEWLAANPGQCATAARIPGGPTVSHWHPAAEEPDTGSRPCGHDDYHDPHEWTDRPGVWCPGHSHADDETAPAAG